MKSEKRHQLEQNWLADQMGKTITAAKPYANIVLGVALVVVIAAVGLTLWTRKASTESARAWQDFYAALDSGNAIEFENVVEHYPGSVAAHWAEVLVADLHLSKGCDELFKSRAGANQELKKAIESYDQLLDTSSNPAIRERATLGLARAWESQGDLDKAAKHYEALVKQWPDGPYTTFAEWRIAAVATPAIRKFYDEFAKFDPKPAYSKPALDPLKFDDFDMPSPDEPLVPRFDPLNLDETSATESSKTDLPEPESPSTETPATPSTEVPATPSTEVPKAPSTEVPATPADAKSDAPEEE
ncbi:MAG: tetratricopeptide repeat protein [Pirellulales bacterium]|nr:tetratricopeptide repeat protein [Pirellulales bacterium]